MREEDGAGLQRRCLLTGNFYMLANGVDDYEVVAKAMHFCECDVHVLFYDSKPFACCWAVTKICR